MGRSTPREGHNLYLPQEKRSFGFSLQKFGGLKQPSSNGTFSFNGLKSCCWYCPVLYTYLVPPTELWFFSKIWNVDDWDAFVHCPLKRIMKICIPISNAKDVVFLEYRARVSHSVILKGIWTCVFLRGKFTFI